jgi:hypothetical protein
MLCEAAASLIYVFCVINMSIYMGGTLIIILTLLLASPGMGLEVFAQNK